MCSKMEKARHLSSCKRKLTTPTVLEFYRKVLPESCVDFSSQDGKRFFTSALGSGELGQRQFSWRGRRQRTGNFQAMRTFTSNWDLNSELKRNLPFVASLRWVDPGQVWKGPWRWYHEAMLDCCMSLDRIKERGISFRQFVCLARCNRLAVDPRKLEENADQEEGIITLREDIKRSTASETDVLVLNYDRSTLGQTGTGHFSPVGAYDPDSDRALILDVARFKYPPHWVKVPLIYEAVKHPRGYMFLTLEEQTRPLVMFELSKAFVEADEEFWSEVKQWGEWLSESASEFDSPSAVFFAAGVKLKEIFPPHLCKHRDHKCCSSNPDLECQCLKKSLETCSQLLCTEIGRLESFSSLAKMEPDQDRRVPLAVLLLSWPYGGVEGSREEVLRDYSKAQVAHLSKDTKNEIRILGAQIKVLVKERPDCNSRSV